MDITAISDLHGHYPQLEGGDLLIVAGDLTATDTAIEYQTFKAWLLGQDYKKKIVISGNHDNYLINPCDSLWVMPRLEYLCDSGTEFEGLKIWGSPWTLRFPGMNPHCMAFTVDTEEELAEKFASIPSDVDILITHSPPYKILDEVKDFYSGNIINVGSRYLRGALEYVFRPNLWVCAHIHEGYGQYDYKGMTKIVNASHVNESYEPVNKPIRIEL